MKLKRLLPLYLLFFLPFSLSSQESFSKEFSFIADNDLFISYVKDQYYSSGFFFEYRWLDQNSTDKDKLIKEWTLSHEIYTPYKSIVTYKSEHDRPFAGYVYLSHNRLKVTNKFLKKSSYQLGVLGPAALGKELQMFIHDIYGFKEPIGWKYQIKNNIALNYSSEITKKIGEKKHKLKDVFYSYGYQIGTVKINTFFTLQGRIGFKELSSFQNSIAFRTNLQHQEKRKVESLLIWKISNRFVVYDATIQGSLFNYKSPVTFTPNRFQLAAELGYLFTANQWNFGYKVVYNSNERRNLTNNTGHFYATLFLSKLFN